MYCIPRYDIYTDRCNERDLCQDFPADAEYIFALHAMQMHFVNRGSALEIPVVRVMNTAHWIAAYMFQTTCSGDQYEYDALAYNSMGRDRNLAVIVLIVLATMLRRTDGMHARNCRSVLIADRPDDFYEGVSLYEQFLNSAEAHFAEEDFLTDIAAQVAHIRDLETQNQQQATQILALKKQLTMSEERQSPVIHVAGNYIDIHDNTHCNIYATDPSQTQAEQETVETMDSSDLLPLPKNGKYSEVRKYIEERKRFDEDFKMFCLSHTLRDLCSKLTDIFGWYVDENSLGKNLNRNNRT